MNRCSVHAGSLFSVRLSRDELSDLWSLKDIENACKFEDLRLTKEKISVQEVLGKAVAEAFHA